jgi:lysozyme
VSWLDFAIPLVSRWEGCAKRVKGMIYPYLDKLAKPAVWTRGYGRTYGIAEDSPPITPEEAKAELAEGLKTYAAKCVKLAPALAGNPQCLAAVASWAWNCGTGAFKVSRLRRAINDGRWEDAAELIRKPRTAGGVELRGLVRRREAEAALFRAGIHE